MSDPLIKLRQLLARVKTVAEKHNLTVEAFSFDPAITEDGHDTAKLAFALSAEAVESEMETQKRNTDAEFEAMMSGLAFDGDTITDKEDEKEAMDEARRAFLDKFGKDT